MKVYKKTCPICEKEITSLYKRQLESNYKIHLAHCKTKGELPSSEEEEDASNVLEVRE